MTDKENLKIGLEEISDFFFEMYRKETDQYKAIKAKEYSDIADDALSLLKKQEAIKPKIDAFGYPYCPKCKVLVYQTWGFCPHCGQEVMWE